MKILNPRWAIILNIFFSVLGLVLNIVINLVLTPYITNNLGVEAYGYIGLANNVVGYIEIISVALNSLAARYVALEYHKMDYGKANKYYNSVIVANLFLSFIILVPMCIFIFYLDNLIKIPLNMVLDVKILFLLVVINYTLMLLSNCFNIATFIKNRLDITAFLKNISYLIKALALVIIFSLFIPSVWMVSVAIIISSLFLLISNIYLTKKLTPNLAINPKKSSVTAVKELVSNGSWNSISSLGVTLNSGLDLLVTNIFINATAMGQLSVVKSITFIFNTFVAVFTQAFRPIQLEAYSKNDQKGMINEFNLSMKVTGYICSVTFAGLFALGYSFLEFWIPGQDTKTIYKVLIIVLVGDVMGAVSYPLNYVFTIINKLKVPSMISILNGILNLILILLLLQMTGLGLYAVVLTTAFLNIVVQLIIIPILACYYLKLSYFTFYPVILKSVLNCFALSIIFMFVSKLYIQIDSWFGLIVWIIVLGGGGTIISLFILFSSQERTKILGILLKKIKGKKST
ncbi:oligosaccharide flippase family protein [Priestia aryabhattai]|uniref:oligosaccharide flippase family protein n=1 Tax=Priestia aryabhattai TaxID=412384 RepID=UPI003981E022